MRKQTILLSLLFLIPLFGICQTEDIPLSKNVMTEDIPLSRKELRKQRPLYINLSAGIEFSSFTDYATSALTYSGTPINANFSILKADKIRETEFGMNITSGSYNAIVGEHSASSDVNAFKLYYSKLYRINGISNDKWNFKAGGQFNTDLIIRINNSLMNNTFGMDMSPTLMGSFKITRDLSRKSDIIKRFLFFKYTLPEKKEDLSFTMNVGLINASLRNDFAYLNHSSVLNTYQIFDNYDFNLFSGLKLSSAVDYTVFLKNKNAIRYSYLWDAYKSGGKFEPFQMVHHTLRFTLLFNLNNK